jgi:asparagine synthase (glutamine-hydrolysing)
VHGLAPERRASLRRLTEGATPLRAISALELANFLEQRLLRDTDAASMAVSLEVRVPLLDHLVIEAAARLSDRRRFEPLGRKQALRDAALDGLDPAIFDRPKSGFVLPIERWARGGMQREVAETLRDARACQAAGLAPQAVARLWSAFEAGPPESTGRGSGRSSRSCAGAGSTPSALPDRRGGLRALRPMPS